MDYFFKKTQDAYLWLLDHFGVYKGTTMFVLYVTMIILSGPFQLWDAAFIVIAALFAAVDWSRQHQGLYEQINMSASVFEGSVVFRSLTVGLTFGGLAFAILTMPDWYWMIPAHLMYFVFSCSFTIRVREREPKELFPAQEPAHASSNAG